MASIRSVTLAANNVEGVVAFYNAVVGADLQPLDAPPGFHVGAIDTVRFVVCPNSVAQVDAKQNRQQFSFAVDDAAAAHQRGLDHGGSTMEPGIQHDDDAVRAWLYDPDGNSLELLQPRQP